METFFINTKNSKTSERHKLMALVSFSIYYTWKNVKSTYNNNK